MDGQTDSNFVEASNHVRLSIGVGNDVNSPDNRDALDIQGGACLTLNVGRWDREITEAISPVWGAGTDPIGISFRVNDDQKMFIDKDGNVGIGTTDPQAKLQVSGGAIMPAVGNNNTSGIYFPPNPGIGTGDAAWIRYYVREGTEEDTTFEIGTSNDADDHIVLQTSGGVGIGKVPDTSNGVKLDVNGNVKATNIEQASDATLKENIQTIKDGLEKILGLRGVSYQWKDDKKAAQETHIGLVAQEVEGIFPELVSTDSQGMKSLSYSKLIAPLIEAIKEQQGQILELVNQVQQQQAQIGQLQALKNG